MKKAEEPESQMDLPSPVLGDTEAAGSSDSKETADTRTSDSSLCFCYLKNVANCLHDKSSPSYVNQKYFIFAGKPAVKRKRSEETEECVQVRLSSEPFTHPVPVSSLSSPVTCLYVFK